MRFESHLALLLLLALPALLALRLFRRGSGSLRFSTIVHAAKSGQSLRRLLVWVPTVLRFLVLLLLGVGIARPQKGTARVRDYSKGVAIEMVVDRSGSMAAELEFRGRHMNRLEVVKHVFKDFVEGDGKALNGRRNDLIGMVAFARYPDTVCPLTLGHGALTHFLDSVQLVKRRNEDGTAIGDAVSLAAARLRTAEETLAKQTGGRAKDYEIKSKIVILLTDGENNCGDTSVLKAAELCKEWGVKVYAIAVGADESVNVMRTAFGAFKIPLPQQRVDTSEIEALASRTGGMFRLATSGRMLERIYREIDRMERSEVESERVVDYSEIFAPFVLAALALLVLEVLLNCTVFRRIP